MLRSESSNSAFEACSFSAFSLAITACLSLSTNTSFAFLQFGSVNYVLCIQAHRIVD
eukprot:c27053_g2_i1 orf=237-407(+)